MSLRSLLWCALLAPTLAVAQPKLTFAFDAGLPENPALTQQKLTTLLGRLPAWVHVPGNFVSVQTGPDGVTNPTTTLWLAPDVKAQFDRVAASMDAGAMAWPAPTFCTVSSAFVLPTTSLLATGAATGCAQYETAVRTQLSATNLNTCIELEEPERYVVEGRAPASATQQQLVTFADTKTAAGIEGQIALAGGALGLVKPPEGLLPPGWVQTLRSVLWKLRASPTPRVATARAALTSAQMTLTTQASCFDVTKANLLRTQLGQMVTELGAIEQHVAQVVSSGTATATQQAQCLQARGRTRPALPYPSLTDEEREFIGYWLGGVFWRLRGGGLIVLGQTQSARTFYARRPFREIARIANGTAVAQNAADSIYCGLFDGWGSWFDMGTYHNASAPAEDNQDTYYDLVQMTDRGRQHVADFPLTSTSCYVQGVSFSVNKSPEEYLRDANYDSLGFYAAGLEFGPCYLYSLNPHKNFNYYTETQAPAPYSAMFQAPAFTAIGEFCVGAALGSSLVRSLLNGTPTGQAPTTLCGTKTCGTDACGNSCGTCGSGTMCNANGSCVAGAGGGAGGGSAGGGSAGGGLGGGSAGGSAGGSVGGGTAGGGNGGGSSGGGLGGGSAGGGSGGDANGGGSAGGDANGVVMGGGSGGGLEQPTPAGCGCGSANFAGAIGLLGLALRRRRARR